MDLQKLSDIRSATELRISTELQRPTDLQSATNDQLVAELKRLVGDERQVTLQVLGHLAEVERRWLYRELGFPSLFEYAVRELGYSEAAAYRRISAMRALRDVPEIAPALESGRLSVATVSRAQTFLRREKMQARREYSPQDKRELFESLAGKSAREVEQALVARAPESAVPMSRERVVSETHTELRVVLESRVMEKLWRARDLGAHRLRDINSYAELVEMLLDLALRELDPAGETAGVPGTEDSHIPRGAEGSEGPEVRLLPPRNQLGGSTKASPSRYIRIEDKRRIWRRDGGACAYQDLKTGRRCASRHRLQIDHILPFAAGGSSGAENLRLLCASHNAHASAAWFGRRWT